MKIIVFNVGPVSHYLHKNHAIFYDKNGRKYQNVSRKRGTIDVWSNQRLLGTRAEVESYARDAECLLLIRRLPSQSEYSDPAVHRVITEAFPTARRAFLSRDSRIEVLFWSRTADAIESGDAKAPIPAGSQCGDQVVSDT